MHWIDKQRATAALGTALRERGWKLYGWKNDQSDPLTDYFSPESWQGVAEKSGVILAVAVTPYHVRAWSGKNGWPAFHAVPKGKSWQIEREGKVIAAGIGLSQCFDDYRSGSADHDIQALIDRIEAAAFKPAREAAHRRADPNGEIRIELERDWTWVYFPSKPDEAARERMKALGGRFSGKRLGWYFTKPVDLSFLTASSTDSQTASPPGNRLSPGER